MSLKMIAYWLPLFELKLVDCFDWKEILETKKMKTKTYQRNRNEYVQ